mgnify:FL=1
MTPFTPPSRSPSLPQVAAESDQDALVAKSRATYEDATVASSSMSATDPLRLSVSLNHSVLLREVAADEEDSGNAVAIAQAAFDGAMAGLSSLDEEQCVPRCHGGVVSCGVKAKLGKEARVHAFVSGYFALG